jgi:quercetin dioxygenase-like cupin family protein
MYQKTINASDCEKVALGFPGVSMALLTGDPRGDGMYVMTTLGAGSVVPAHSHGAADEFVYVVSGDFVEAGKTYGPGMAFYGVAGTVHGPHSSVSGCVLLTHYSAPLDFIPAT